MEHEKKDIPNENDIADEPADISSNPKTAFKNKQPHPFRWFLFLIILTAAILYGLQWYLDLEAQAIVYAQQTANAVVETSDLSLTQPPQEKAINATETPTPIPATPTSDPIMQHTQTIAVQLTEVAEFQQTITPD